MTVEEAPTMPLNCRTAAPPLPVPPLDGEALEPSDGAALVVLVGAGRTTRRVPVPSSVTGLARVRFWSVGGLTSTGGKFAGGVCAWAMEALSARILVANRSERRRFAAVMAEDMVQTSV
jgi:hypothetical protein